MSRVEANTSSVTLSIEPRGESVSTMKAPHLKYYGGKVLKNPKFISLYLGDYWSNGKGSEEKAHLDKFSKYLPKSPHTSIWKEYKAGAVDFLGSQIVGEQQVPRTVGEDDIQQLVMNAVEAAPGGKVLPETIYTVFLPPNVVLESSDGASSLYGLGGYHGSLDLDNKKRVYYSAITYSSKSNGVDITGRPRDNITIAASHEWSETVTDPDVNNGKLGWYDCRYGEVGDIPLNIGIPLKNIYDTLGGFTVQKEWSNRDKTSEVVERLK